MIKPNRQTGLFKHKLAESGCNLHQANILFKENLLSFDPVGKEEYEGLEIEELEFLKSLFFASGLTASTVKAMLSKLGKPYSYSFDVIYWDYGSQEWKELPQDAESYISDNLRDIIFDNFDKFLENLSEDDADELSTIKDAISVRLKEIAIVKGRN
ncbi:hypothetical protein HYU93_01810 [Candidatus Daviesbacteria bacterium]|nr:hypothetical protein [Candidatus Daviesbacteria bacterium]